MACSNAFAQTNRAIHKQRVIAFARDWSHGQRGRVRKVVVVADNECVELVFSGLKPSSGADGCCFVRAAAGNRRF